MPEARSYKHYLNDKPLFAGECEWPQTPNIKDDLDKLKNDPRFNPQTPTELEWSIRIRMRINDLLNTISHMNIGERRELRQLVGMPECSRFLWMLNGEGGWTPPIYEQEEKPVYGIGLRSYYYEIYRRMHVS